MTALSSLPRPHTGITTDDFAYVADLLVRRCGISLSPGKEYLVAARLAPVTAEHGLASITDLVKALRRDNGHGTLTSDVVEAMTTNETFWFRDTHPFTALRTQILPDVLLHNTGTRALRLWSAACSSGQELYSIAMLLDEHFPELAGWSVDLLGTDLAAGVVRKATQGRYTATEVARGLPPALLSRYLRPDGAGHRVVDHLRARTRFAEQNLIAPWPTRPPLDVIFMRNVLIYFDIEVKRELLTRAHRALRPGGYLVLGAGETTLGVDVPLTPVTTAGAVCYQKHG